MPRGNHRGRQMEAGEVRAISAQEQESSAVRPEWEPLEAVLSPDLCGDFMFMGKVGDICLYKHRWTRRYLNLDSQLQAWRYDGPHYSAIPIRTALTHAFQ